MLNSPRPLDLSDKDAQTRKFLMGCSGQTLADYLMVRHARAANFRRELFDLLDRWVEATAEARLAAEVNAIREEMKHASTLPFRRKEVEENPPDGDMAPALSPLNPAQPRRRHHNAVFRKPVA